MIMGDATSLKPVRRRAERIESIQAMRGIAAVLVVVAHSIALAFSGRAREGWALVAHLGNFEHFGAIGVDLFFVISGFVMAFSVASSKGPRGAGVFLAKRWARIAPPYWIVGGAMVFLGIVGLLRTVKVDAGSVFNLIMFIPWTDASTYSVPPLFVGWTLSFEFSFYLMVAAMVALGLAQRMGWLAFALVAIVSVALVFPTDIFILRWFSNPIMLEFALGIAAYLLWSSKWTSRHRRLCFAGGVAGALALAAQIVTGYGGVWDMGAVLDGSQSLPRVVMWGIPAFLIFVAALPMRLGANFVGAGLARLGNASYSLYLVHIPVLYILGRLLEMSPIKLPADIITVIGAVAAVTAGLIYFRLVETPVTAWTMGRVKSITAART
ncbi:acyltransferase family protein [Arthrobacter sp. KNU-44]|uniref:acyltransferase family protein n=1 Tax=Arthrobacter sp. KNU-44 TaxID=3450744 RepID=UPI003F4337FF